MPSPSPTITRAVKLKRRPPLTTFATRLMATTRSMYWFLSSPPPRPPRPPRPPPRSPRWGPLMGSTSSVLYKLRFVVSTSLDHRCAQLDHRCAQKARPPSRAPSASAATRPWYLFPARSKTTEATPWVLARSATSSPTLRALTVLSPSRVRTSASIVEACASVLPTRSSTTCTGMCLEDRVTTRRGRSAGPLTFLRPRIWRRARDAIRPEVCLPVRSEMAMSLASLSDLATNPLTRVPHALALVGLGLAKLADVGGDLADELLVDALDAEAGGAVDGEGDAVGGVERGRVAVAELERQLGGALGEQAVADADDLELLLVALGDADDHVVHERAGQAVTG